MSVGRVLSSLLAAAAVGGCAVVALGMSHAANVADPITSDPTVAAAPSRTARPAVPPEPSPVAVVSSAAGVSTSPPDVRPTRPVSSRLAPVTTVVATTPVAPSSTAPAPRPATTAVVVRPKVTVRTTTAPAPTRVRTATAGQALPLRFSTGTATRVITVVGRSYGGTTATLQAWNKVSTGRWVKYGTAMTAHIGADGMSTQASESRSATPIGSFTLTQAFGHNSNPGTGLPYLHTNANDWWISQAGPLYNTHQRCAYSCAFNRGAPNEHLYYETPYYNYAVVIDYNTRNAPGGVHAGRGSAFFLHVTDGSATAGCVAIPQSRLITIMRWLTPAAHPRILIGVA